METLNWNSAVRSELRETVELHRSPYGTHAELTSVARAPAAKAGGPGFDSLWLPWDFSLPAGLLMLMG